MEEALPGDSQWQDNISENLPLSFQGPDTLEVFATAAQLPHPGLGESRRVIGRPFDKGKFEQTPEDAGPADIWENRIPGRERSKHKCSETTPRSETVRLPRQLNPE